MSFVDGWLPYRSQAVDLLSRTNSANQILVNQILNAPFAGNGANFIGTPIRKTKSQNLCREKCMC